MIMNYDNSFYLCNKRKSEKRQWDINERRSSTKSSRSELERNLSRKLDFSVTFSIIRRRYITMTRLQDAFITSSCWQGSHLAKIAIRKHKVEERELRESLEEEQWRHNRFLRAIKGNRTRKSKHSSTHV